MNSAAAGNDIEIKHMSTSYMIGMDVGSTTVKAVVVEVATDKILWDDYQRHDTKQPEKVLELLKQIESDIPDLKLENTRVFVTGSGGNGLTAHHFEKRQGDASAKAAKDGAPR